MITHRVIGSIDKDKIVEFLGRAPKWALRKGELRLEPERLEPEISITLESGLDYLRCATYFPYQGQIRFVMIGGCTPIDIANAMRFVERARRKAQQIVESGRCEEEEEAA